MDHLSGCSLMMQRMSIANLNRQFRPAVTFKIISSYLTNETMDSPVDSCNMSP
jgi:hypothetical protein